MKIKIFGLLACFFVLTYSFSTNSIVSNCNADAFFGKPCAPSGEILEIRPKYDGPPGFVYELGQFATLVEVLEHLEVPRMDYEDLCDGDCEDGKECVPLTFVNDLRTDPNFGTLSWDPPKQGSRAEATLVLGEGWGATLAIEAETCGCH